MKSPSVPKMEQWPCFGHPCFKKYLFLVLQAFPNRVLQLSEDMKKVELAEELKGEIRQMFRSNGESQIGLSSLDETGM
jgi:hypothetical protein